MMISKFKSQFPVSSLFRIFISVLCSLYKSLFNLKKRIITCFQVWLPVAIKVYFS